LFLSSPASVSRPKSEVELELEAWEADLRRTLGKHAAYLTAIQVPLAEAAEAVRGQLSDIATGRVRAQGSGEKL